MDSLDTGCPAILVLGRICQGCYVKLGEKIDLSPNSARPYFFRRYFMSKKRLKKNFGKKRHFWRFAPIFCKPKYFENFIFPYIKEIL